MKALKERLFQFVTYLAALFTIICMLAIIYGIFREGLPLFRVVNLKQFIFTNNWYPMEDALRKPTKKNRRNVL